jgi:hypothetical protein
MMPVELLTALPPRQQALVVVAVLLDGRDAAEYLQADVQYGEQLAKACREIALLAPDLRMPLLGTMLRRLLSTISQE